MNNKAKKLFKELYQSLFGDTPDGTSQDGSDKDLLSKDASSEGGFTHMTFELCSVVKSMDEDARLVTCVVMDAPGAIDGHGDVIEKSADSVSGETMIFDAMVDYMVETGGQLGLQHVFKNDGAVLVENSIMREDTTIGTKLVEKGAWVQTWKITNDAQWDMWKSGELTGFSVGGEAVFEEA